jgi:hypothetical protein
MIWASLSAVIAIALVHLRSGKRPLLHDSRSALSAAGGVALAYVFMHVLPELAQSQEYLLEWVDARRQVMIEEHVYLFALAGLLVFFTAIGVERDMARNQRAFYRVELTTFALYNVLIGYLLTRRMASGIMSLVLFTIAVVAHFIAVDSDLYERHKEYYRSNGAWILAVSLIVGWLLAAFTELHPLLVIAGFSFLSGAIIVNTFRVELPRADKRNYKALITGAGLYALLILLMNRFS